MPPSITQLMGQSDRGLVGQNGILKSGEKVESDIIGVNVIVKDIFNLVEPGNGSRANGVIQPRHRLTCLEQANIPSGLAIDGVNHAFHNDTSAERYNKDAAELAWKRTVEFLKAKLA